MGQEIAKLFISEEVKESKVEKNEISGGKIKSSEVGGTNLEGEVKKYE